MVLRGVWYRTTCIRFHAVALLLPYFCVVGTCPSTLAKGRPPPPGFSAKTLDTVRIGQDFAEPTVAAIGPGQKAECNAGRLIFATGYRIVSTDLSGGDQVSFDVVSDGIKPDPNSPKAPQR